MCAAGCWVRSRSWKLEGVCGMCTWRAWECLDELREFVSGFVACYAFVGGAWEYESRSGLDTVAVCVVRACHVAAYCGRRWLGGNECRTSTVSGWPGRIRAVSVCALLGCTGWSAGYVGSVCTAEAESGVATVSLLQVYFERQLLQGIKCGFSCDV